MDWLLLCESKWLAFVKLFQSLLLFLNVSDETKILCYYIVVPIIHTLYNGRGTAISPGLLEIISLFEIMFRMKGNLCCALQVNGYREHSQTAS